MNYNERRGGTAREERGRRNDTSQYIKEERSICTHHGGMQEDARDSRRSASIFAYHLR